MPLCAACGFLLTRPLPVLFLPPARPGESSQVAAPTIVRDDSMLVRGTTRVVRDPKDWAKYENLGYHHTEGYRSSYVTREGYGFGDSLYSSAGRYTYTEDSFRGSGGYLPAARPPNYF